MTDKASLLERVHDDDDHWALRSLNLGYLYRFKPDYDVHPNESCVAIRTSSKNLQVPYERSIMSQLVREDI